MSVQDGIKKAEEAGLDLVEIAPTANPPVCRIMDHSRFKYEQEKKEKDKKDAAADKDAKGKKAVAQGEVSVQDAGAQRAAGKEPA